MGYLLGLDPSVKKSGYVVLDIDAPDNVVEEKGLLKTSPTDGILVQRLLKQKQQVKDLLLKYDIKYVGCEAPFFEAFSTEMLYALNQFLHTLYLELELTVVYFPPQMLKKLVFPEEKVRDIHKAEMIDQAKTVLNLHGHRLAEDTADAYWAGFFGKRFYKCFVEKSLPQEELGAYEREKFCGKHTFTRGAKKGTTELYGIIYRENELFFDFKKIKRRQEDACKEKGND